MKSGQLQSPTETAERPVRWWIKRIGHRRLTEIHPIDIERGLGELRRTPKAKPRAGKDPGAGVEKRSASTLNRYLRAVSAVLQDYTYENGGLDFNPARLVKRNP